MREVTEEMLAAVERMRAYTQERPQEDCSWVFPLLPTVLPAGWRVLREAEDGRWWQKSLPELRVCVTGATEEDGRRWLHLSASHRQRIPTYDELLEVKELFLGREAKAIMVLPARSEHVNLCERVLHLWRCVDEDPLPDFTRGLKSL